MADTTPNQPQPNNTSNQQTSQPSGQNQPVTVVERGNGISIHWPSSQTTNQ